MVECFLDGLYLDVTLPLLTLLLGLVTRLLFHYLILLLRLHYIDVWRKLMIGESDACVTWVRGG